MWDINVGSCQLSVTVKVETTPPNIHWPFCQIMGLPWWFVNIHPSEALEGYQQSRGLQWDVQPNSCPSWSSQRRNNSEVLQQMNILSSLEPAGET